MHHYCTLFDRKYLAKGLVLHDSLMRHSSESFLVHVLAMDLDTVRILQDLNLPNVDLMSLHAFEHAMNMEPVKASRTRQEYMWTAASNLMEYLMPWMDESGITYLDADLMFFDDPKVIFDELGQRSIAITPHRFMMNDRIRLQQNGQFNVGIVVVRNTETGRACVKKWAAQTREWCFYRLEDGKFGDQKYLDTWPEDYPGEVAVLENLGINVGPWSVRNFDIHERTWTETVGSDVVIRKVFVNNYSLVVYHFHEFKDEQHLTNWQLRDCDRDLIYKPYLIAWHAANECIRRVEMLADEEMKRLEVQAGRA